MLRVGMHMHERVVAALTVESFFALHFRLFRLGELPTSLPQSESYTTCVYRAIKLEDNRSAPESAPGSRLLCLQDKRV
jgi:hypothetical protein